MIQLNCDYTFKSFLMHHQKVNVSVQMRSENMENRDFFMKLRKIERNRKVYIYENWSLSKEVYLSKI